MVTKLYSPEEVAELTGLKPSTIRTWLRNGKLKGIKMRGRTWRISEEAVEEFIRASEVKQTGE
jgi:excisionase family DNA binding protein